MIALMLPTAADMSEFNQMRAAIAMDIADFYPTMIWKLLLQTHAVN